MSTSHTTESIDESEVETWRKSLFAIAKDLQSFHISTLTSTYSCSNNNEVDNKLNILQSLLNKRKKQTKKLKANIKTACLIAKTVIAAKENESIYLSSQLNQVKSNAVMLCQKNMKTDKDIKILSNENKFLIDKVETLGKFVSLSYQELQKIRNEPIDDLPVFDKLKQIIVCCGQYYADYCNEHEKYRQLEDRNRYLCNKIKFLDSNIKAKAEEMKMIAQQNSRLQKENESLRLLDKQLHKNCSVIAFSQSDNRMAQTKPKEQVQVTSLKKMTENNSRDSAVQKLNLNNHLYLVKNLLRDQDCMLSELRQISQELNSDVFETS